MADTVLVSTHDLPLAGALRTAFEADGFAVDLIPGPEHGERYGRAGREAVLLVLTGCPVDDAWVELAEGVLQVPWFVVPGEGRGVSAGGPGAAGAVEVFPPGVDPDEVALVGRRTVERRRLQASTGIVGESDAIRELLERVVQIAPVDSTVLVTGESGTGKELVARGIHALSPRKHRAFLAVNVAALSESLLESELFGHEKGAFTGAIDTRKGFFELANRGTLFLDEIGEMPLSTQTKLLRALEQGEILRVGAERPLEVNVRIVAATNRELREAVARGEFRRDLYYRLNILDLRLPPLRERREDITLLIRHFVRQISARVERPFPGLTPEALRLLEGHDWPGNVRELRNLVESMVVLSPGRPIRPDDLPLEIRRPGSFLPAPRMGALPVPAAPPGLPQPARASSAPELSGPGASLPAAAGSGLRPELEFVFRTLVDLRVDMEELRREFEAYRDEVDAGGGASARSPGAELGYTRPRYGDEDPRGPDARHPDRRGPDFHVPHRRSPDRGTDLTEVAAEYDDAGRPQPPGELAPATGPSSAPDPTFGPDPEGSPASDPSRPPLVEVRPGMTMDQIEEAAIRAVLEETGGNRRLAAERLAIGERTLYRKIKRYEIDL